MQRHLQYEVQMSLVPLLSIPAKENNNFEHLFSSPADWALETSTVVPGISSQGALYAPLSWELPLSPSILWGKNASKQNKNQHLLLIDCHWHKITSWWKTNYTHMFYKKFFPFFHNILDYVSIKTDKLRKRSNRKSSFTCLNLRNQWILMF